MRRIVSVMAVMALMAALVALGAGSAVAAPVSEPNPGTPNSAKSANCIAVFSSGVTANGRAPGGTLGEGNNAPGQTGPSGGARGDEIKALQEACNNANLK